MKPKLYLRPIGFSLGLLLLMGLLSSSPLFAQNYNAGVGSGTGGSGTYNVFVGPYAGPSNTTGSYNSFLGTGAGASNITGSNNSFLGYGAGYANTEGNNNSFVGYGAGNSNVGGENNCFLGNLAGLYNKAGSNNSFLGNNAGYFNTTGTFNSCMGYQAGYINSTGSHNLFLGYSANPSTGTLFNAGAIGSRAYVSASNSLVLGAIKGVNGATDSTNVGIGTTAPAYLLQVNGNAAKPGGGSWTVPADQRLQKNVLAFRDGLEVLAKVRPVWFEYNGQAGMPTNQKYVGVIAQEMKEITPYMVGSFTYQDPTGQKTDYLDYDANALPYLLVNAVQQQQKQIQALQTQIDLLRQLLNQERPAPSPQTAAGSTVEAHLWQNVPNPTDGTTRIHYRLPQQARQAQINLYSLKGELLQSFRLTQRGEGELSVETTTLPEGTYVYRLLVDGQQIDTKKLLLSR
ncbi:tail fiber domain-containing protein [Hymenobacter sp. BT664]|uniref:Tail fiber domain-containing protein n=1 Tax=Hymenobacter montanus TaxID=2771359 RepID=A0A927BH42_9BACT|nr:tail fiber domain-containing protein [Hymenobacter montanus]MBD2769953.1 tail fiber domain-containing protein [Hymenobacter montanus]